MSSIINLEKLDKCIDILKQLSAALDFAFKLFQIEQSFFQL